MSVPDELVASFVAVTGADAATAQGLLEVGYQTAKPFGLVVRIDRMGFLVQACNMDVESAIQLFFDTQTAPMQQNDEALASSLQQRDIRSTQAG